ncbi:MAG: aldo/keto reductase [Acidimicrobiales bacterium]
MDAGRRTGPRLGFGCVDLGSATRGSSVKRDVRLVHAALDSGLTTFDTSGAYGNGASELILGRALAGRRAGVTISTKVGYQFVERSLRQQSMRRVLAPFVARARARVAPSSSHRSSSTSAYSAQDFSAPAITAGLESSLRRLRTDHIDVLHLHAPRSVLPAAQAAVEQLVASGKVHRFGIGAEHVDVAAAWMAETRVDVLQVPFGVLDPEAATEIFPDAIRSGVSIWTRGVLGGGYIALAMQEDADPGSTFLRSDPKWPLIEDLLRTASQAGVPLSRLALDYVRSCDGIEVILIGIHSTEHLARNLSVMSGPAADASLMEATRAVLERWTRPDATL